MIAVRGNVDNGPVGIRAAVHCGREGGGASIYVIHDIHTLDLDPAAAGFHMVVSGHSHKPGSVERAGVLYVNPGSAGPGDSSCLPQSP